MKFLVVTCFEIDPTLSHDFDQRTEEVVVATFHVRVQAIYLISDLCFQQMAVMAGEIVVEAEHQWASMLYDHHPDVEICL